MVVVHGLVHFTTTFVCEYGPDDVCGDVDCSLTKRGGCDPIIRRCDIDA